MQRTLLLTVALAVVGSTLGAGQSTVGVSTPKGEVTVTTDEAAALAGSVIKSSLRGVGRMLGAMRGTAPGPSMASLPDLGDVEVRLDEVNQRYAVTTAAGPRIYVDARSGEYSIDLRGAEEVPGGLIEESLAAVGSMIRGLRTLNGSGAAIAAPIAPEAGPLGLSALEIDRLVRLWRAEGIAEAEIERRRADLESADAGFRAAMKQLDESMQQLDREMEELQRQMEELEDGGGR